MPHLAPFLPQALPFAVAADFAWKSGGLELAFRLDDRQGLLLDGPGPQLKKLGAGYVRRADGLWKTTCFEAFFGRPGEDGYWELNLGSGGAWNLYRFTGYRSPQPPSPSDDFLLTKLEAGEGTVACRLELPGPPFALEASLCMVARTAAGIHYLSTKHAGAKPDFHLRQSFTLPVEP